MQASVLSPEAGYANTNTPVNDDSLVLRLDFGGFRFFDGIGDYRDTFGAAVALVIDHAYRGKAVARSALASRPFRA